MSDDNLNLTAVAAGSLNLAGNLVVLLVQKGVITAEDAVALKALAGDGQPEVAKALDQVIKVTHR